MTTATEYVNYKGKHSDAPAKTYKVVGMKTDVGKFGKHKGKPINLVTLQGLWEGASTFTVPYAWTTPAEKPAEDTPAGKKGSGIKVPEVPALLNTAKQHLKWPKIRLQAGDGSPVVLSLAGPNAKQPGTVNVTDGGKFGESVWYGRLGTDGEFYPGKDSTPSVAALLAHLATDPIGVAESYGKLTGNCCFCGQALTDPKSTAVGYGPICAGHYNLPWGDEKIIPVKGPITTEDVAGVPGVTPTVLADQLTDWEMNVKTGLITASEEISTLGWAGFPGGFLLSNPQTDKTVPFVWWGDGHDGEGEHLYTIYRQAGDGPLAVKIFND